MADASHNFCYPVGCLENDRLRLEPFNPVSHAKPFWEACHGTEMWKYLPQGPSSTVEEWVDTFYLKRIQPNPGTFVFAVISKVVPGIDSPQEEVAGIIGFLNTEPANEATEIGFVMIIPKYQRTFVATNAVGLLLMYALDSKEHGGLALRRVQWQANSLNAASIRLARRLHFTHEGMARWQRILHFGMQGNGKDLTGLEGRNGGVEQRPGRDSAILSMCWDDWIGKREQVVELMAQR